MNQILHGLPTCCLPKAGFGVAPPPPLSRAEAPLGAKKPDLSWTEGGVIMPPLPPLPKNQSKGDSTKLRISGPGAVSSPRTRSEKGARAPKKV